MAVSTPTRMSANGAGSPAEQHLPVLRGRHGAVDDVLAGPLADLGGAPRRVDQRVASRSSLCAFSSLWLAGQHLATVSPRAKSAREAEAIRPSPADRHDGAVLQDGGEVPACSSRGTTLPQSRNVYGRPESRTACFR